MGLLIGLFVVTVVFIFFSMTPSTNSELQSEDAEPEHKWDEHPPSPSPAGTNAKHDTDTAADILTRLKVRLDTGKFGPDSYRKMAQKVKQMYPHEAIPEHLVVGPSPETDPTAGDYELDLSHIQDRRGKLKNLQHNMCLSRGRPFELEMCDEAMEFFFDGSMGRLQLLDGAVPGHCLEARVHGVHEGNLHTYPCHSDGGNQKWVYNPHTKMLKHLHGLCLAASPASEPNKSPMVSVLPCDTRLATEQWAFEIDM